MRTPPELAAGWPRPASCLPDAGPRPEPIPRRTSGGRRRLRRHVEDRPSSSRDLQRAGVTLISGLDSGIHPAKPHGLLPSRSWNSSPVGCPRPALALASAPRRPRAGSPSAPDGWPRARRRPAAGRRRPAERHHGDATSAPRRVTRPRGPALALLLGRRPSTLVSSTSASSGHARRRPARRAASARARARPACMAGTPSTAAPAASPDADADLGVLHPRRTRRASTPRVAIAFR